MISLLVTLELHLEELCFQRTDHHYSLRAKACVSVKDLSRKHTIFNITFYTYGTAMPEIRRLNSLDQKWQSH